MSVTWTDGVTPLNAANMNNLVQDDSVVAAATRIVANKLLVGDANPAWQVLGDGKMQWGAGGASALDANTNLYRSAANNLKTDGRFTSTDLLMSSSEIYARLAGATQVRIGMAGPANESGISFQTGDANLYREAAGKLRTSGYLTAGTLQAKPAGSDPGVTLQNSTSDTFARWKVMSDGHHRWGSGSADWDTNLFRSAVGSLKTASHLYVGDRFVISQDTGALNFGGAAGVYDAFLRWGAANTVETHTLNLVGGMLKFATDTNLYRTGAGSLKTDGYLNVGNQLYVQGSPYSIAVGAASGNAQGAGGTFAGISFGDAFDTVLYRQSGSTLVTDKYFTVGGTTSGSPSGWASLQLYITGLGLRGVTTGPVNSAEPNYRWLITQN